MEIRPAVLDDVDSAVVLHKLFAPYLVVTGTQLRHRLRDRIVPPGAGTFAAVADGEVVGWATTGLIGGSDPLDGQLRLIVDPAYRGRGAGGELLELAHEELRRAGAVSARVFADPDAAAWASRWGYRQTRLVHYAEMDPQKAPELPPVPDGLRLAPLDSLDPRQVYAADEVAQRTKPGDANITTRPYEDWLAGVWELPGMVLDLSVAVLDGDQVVAFTLGNGDHHKVWSQMTATLPDRRGLGLAKLVKCAALHGAAEAGVVGMHTANYDGNSPMIAVNHWLGYTRTATHKVLITHL
ncbi:putative N-acetyltransferase YhbS [Kribbella amoyensis]|uniref:Putative N-acetyltransferase YhbS n=1 Tax=Kribbella amoyensis TaxID=996641 RepID=A0A561BV13_9ACTN|nr:GNAT family N-acetyltransferase [Kribbella amoyensis]TWD82709.1 putative N-acetyltransferase YhbS [Kribbella amoyensis]